MVWSVILCNTNLCYVHTGVIVDLGFLDDNIVLTVADVRDVSAGKVPGLNPRKPER